jgi:hypothetical protein
MFMLSMLFERFGAKESHESLELEKQLQRIFSEIAMNKLHFRICHLLLLLITAGCTSQSGWKTQIASVDFVDGTRILGEVVIVTTREEVLANLGLVKGWRDKLISAGYTDNDIVDGSEVTVWSYCYGWNSGVSQCAHHGHYVAHVPPALRGTLRGDPDNKWETSGDLVEIELIKTVEGYLVGKVVDIYRKAEDWSPCHKTSLQHISELNYAISTLAGVGPARAIWIECEDINSEEWVRRPVLGAPQSLGPPISEWVKIPK